VTADATALEISGLGKSFGGVDALSDVGFRVGHGEIVSLIGPNGAGKTTAFNCLTGMQRADKGTATGRDREGREFPLLGRKPNEITERGVARTFQNLRLFKGMTVLENVMVGRHCRSRAGILGALLRDRRTLDEERRIVSDSMRYLDEVGLGARAGDLAGSLPYAEQKRLEIARALATEPFLLMLDEPAAGMNPAETAELERMVLALVARHSLAVVLIEHDMRLVMGLSRHIVVLNQGRVIAEGAPQEIQSNPEVIRAYLGDEALAHA